MAVRCFPLLAVLAAAAAFGGQGPSLLRNGGFDRDTEGWSSWFAPGQAEGEVRRVPRDGGGAMQIVLKRRARPTAIQIYQGPFAVEQGAWYAVSFEAEAETPTALRVTMIEHAAPYRGLGLPTEVGVGKEWARVSLLVQATRTSANARIDFFPSVTTWLDNVSVRPLGALPPSVRVQAARAGPGWRGDPATLLDGKANTSIGTQYYPDLPLLLTLDLGETRPVGAAIVDGIEYGRHSYVRRMSIEVSAEGSDWRRWASASRTSEGGVAARRTTRFVASNVAVPVRYLRLRISRLRGGARLTEVRILAAESADPAALARLPRVPPESNLAFLGWDYAKVGYALSPGEPLALRFQNQGDQPIEAPLTWRLETYPGDELARGKATLSAGPQAQASVPVALPDGVADGPHRLRFRLADGDPGACYFGFRRARAEPHERLPVVRVAALLDGLDPEGWVKLIAGRAAPHIDVVRALPDDPKAVHAALVMAENWPADSPTLRGLGTYVRGGGRALCFGKLPLSLDEMLPVRIDRTKPWNERPQRLQRGGKLWPSDAERTFRQRAVRVEAREGAKVLERWEDGSPAAVEGRFGDGRVLYLTTAPGRCWRLHPKTRGADELALIALDHLVHDIAAAPTVSPEFVPPVPPPPGEEGQGEPEAPLTLGGGNLGRFGWLVQEGGLVENIGHDAEVRCPADRASWRLVVPGRGPLRGRPAPSPLLTWFAKPVEWRDERGKVYSSTQSLGSGCILWQGAARRLEVTGRATHLACATKDGVRVLEAGEGLPGEELTAPWLVLFRAQPGLRDAPRIVVLVRRPTVVRLGEALELSFGEYGFGSVITGRLFGLRRLAPGETVGWAKALPDEAGRQAASVAAVGLALPCLCDESFEVKREQVEVTCRFRHVIGGDALGMAGRVLAPLPPVLSLARRHGYPVEVDGKVVDTGIATKYGPLEAVEGDTVTYRLPLPPRDHFGVIPVEGKMALGEAIDKYGTQGIATVKRSSGGLTTGDPFLADLREYMGSGQHENPFEAPHLDLYKWWYCFPTVLGRPAFGPAAQKAIDEHHHVHYWKTLNFYPHKALIRYRREPWTGLDYAVSFIWPVMWRDGVRYFVDQNESASVILYCLWAYGQYYGDWTTVRSNWNLAQYVHRYLTRFHDWALMASSNQEFFSTVGIDMLNSEYPGNLAYARIARQVGDERAEALGLYLAAKAAVPTVARLYMPDYIRSITAEGDPWREWKWFWSFHENDVRGSSTMVMRGGSETIASLAIGMLDTSKGTSPEICLLYKRLAAERINAYEREVAAFANEQGVASGWAHLMQRAILGWPRDELLAEARRFHEQKPNWGWQSTKCPGNLAVVCVADTPLFLAEWAPAEYVSGRFTPADDTVRLTLSNREAKPYEVRLYSQRTPTAVRLGDAEHKAWTYDAKAGWLRITLPGQGTAELAIRLGQEAKAPLHPYLSR